MDLPLTTGQTARQQPCRGGLSQDLGINTRILDVNGNVVAVEHSPSTAHYAASTMFHIYGNPVGGVSAECLGLRGSTGEAITMSCSDSKGDWTPHL
jgi:hypothetical protein